MVAAAPESNSPAIRRYLDLLAGALVNDHYLEHEVRIDYLLRCLAAGMKPDTHTLRDPARHMMKRVYTFRQARRAGVLRSADAENLAVLPYTLMGRVRMNALARALDDLDARQVPGDLADVGVDGGGAAIYMKGFAEIHGWDDRTVWVADRFRASAEPRKAPADWS